MDAHFAVSSKIQNLRSTCARRMPASDQKWQEGVGVALTERTVGKQLRELGYRRLSVRPRHPKADEAAQEAFKKASRRR